MQRRAQRELASRSGCGIVSQTRDPSFEAYGALGPAARGFRAPAAAPSGSNLLRGRGVRGAGVISTVGKGEGPT